MTRRQLQLRIEVNVTLGSEDAIAGDYAIDALQEMVNRVAFKAGQMPSGRVFDVSYDHENVQVTIDYAQRNVQVPDGRR